MGGQGGAGLTGSGSGTGTGMDGRVGDLRVGSKVRQFSRGRNDKPSRDYVIARQLKQLASHQPVSDGNEDGRDHIARWDC